MLASQVYRFVLSEALALASELLVTCFFVIFAKALFLCLSFLICPHRSVDTFERVKLKHK